MSASEIAEISKYMTVWFLNHPEGSYQDFRQIPTKHALEVLHDIQKGTQSDKRIDAEFGKGFASYLREAVKPLTLNKEASLDKFG